MKRKPGAHGRKSSKAPVIGTLRKKEHLLGSESSVPQAIRLKHNWKRRSKKKKKSGIGEEICFHPGLSRVLMPSPLLPERQEFRQAPPSPGPRCLSPQLPPLSGPRSPCLSPPHPGSPYLTRDEIPVPDALV